MAREVGKARVLWSQIDSLHRSERAKGGKPVTSVVIDGSITMVYRPQAESRLVVASAAPQCVSEVITRRDGQVLHVARVHDYRARGLATGWAWVGSCLRLLFGGKRQVNQAHVAPVVIAIGQDFAPNIVHNGSGSVHLADLKQHDVDVEIAGSASVEATGEVEYLQVVISGAGSFKGRHLKSLDASLAIAGSGSIKVEAKQKVRSNISGSGSITVFGAPAEKAKKISGSGQVNYA